MGLQRRHAPPTASSEHSQSLDLTEEQQADKDAGVGETAQQRNVGDAQDATDTDRRVECTVAIQLEPYVGKHDG